MKLSEHMLWETIDEQKRKIADLEQDLKHKKIAIRSRSRAILKGVIIMGKTGFMLLGGAITIAGLVVLTLITVLVSQIQEKIIMHKIKKENNLSNQLAKATEIIKNLLPVAKFYNKHWDKSALMDITPIYDAEQFLKEIKENG